MKIVFVCARYYPSIGGVERHVQQVAERLAAKGHNVHIHVEPASQSNPGFFKKFRIWYGMCTQLRLFLSADVIHIHDVFFWYVPLRLLLFYKPVYCTFHGYEGVVPPTKKAVMIRRFSEVFSKKTIEVGAYIKKWYGTHPDKIIYGGATYIISNPSSRVAPKKLRIALIGRLTDDIGIPKYLGFFKELKKKKIPFELHIYGDGPYKKSLEKYGTTHGMIEDIMVPLQKADVVCASSYLTIIDALAFGKTVVALYNNPLKEDYLRCFPMAEDIIISDRPSRAVDVMFTQRKKISARDIVVKAHSLFSWDAITSTYLALWKK